MYAISPSPSWLYEPVSIWELLFQVLREIDPTLLRDLTPSQKQALLARELGATRDAAVDSARVLLSALEMLLLLLWRHVAYYTAPGSPPVQATVGNALRLLASTDPEGFQREVGARVGALVGKIQGLDVVRDFSCSYYCCVCS